MKLRRAYVLRSRAVSAQTTRRSILEAGVSELRARRVSDVRLEDIAARAGVTVQTILRIFGTKARLVETVWDRERDRILAQRHTAAPGDLPGSIRALFDHYEEMGDLVIHNLAEEAHLPDMKAWLMRGRKAHRRSMQRQFAPFLAQRGAGERRMRVDCLVAACDVYTWKLLRRDLGRTRREAENVVLKMVSAILGGN